MAEARKAAGAGRQAGAGTGREAGAGTGREAGAGTGREAGAGTGREAGAEAGTGREAGAGTGREAGARVEAAGGREPGAGSGEARAGAGRSPREVAEDVRRMVAGEGVVFADLFAEDAVFTYPFAGPGMPGELVGREAIREFFGARGEARSLFRMDGVDAVIRETDDPEVVVAEIRHHGWSHVNDAPYRHTAVGVIRVRDGLIVHYDDYMNPIATAQLLGRTSDLAAALTTG